MLNKKSRLYNLLILPSFSIIILAGFLLTFSVNINAASVQTYFPIIQNANNTIPDNVVNWFLQSNQYLDGCHYVIYGPFYSGTESGSTYYEFYFIRWNPSSDSNIRFVVQNDGHTVHIQQSGSVSGFRNGLIRLNSSNNQIYVSVGNGSNLIYSSVVVQSSSYDNNVSWVSNFDVLDTSGNVLLFLVPPVTVPDTGHAENPMDNIPTFVPPIGMHPSQAPTVPSYTFPSLSTKPTWDTDHPFDSLFNLIDWGFDFSYDLLTGILQNIIDWATFFGNLIVWIYEQIWNYFTFFIGWLYRIFEFLFSPIYNFLEALFHDGDDVISLADLLYNLYVRFDTFANTLFSDSWFINYWNNFEHKLDDALQYFSKIVLFFTSFVALGIDSSGEFAIGTFINNLFLPNPAEVAAILYANDEFDAFSTTVAIFQSFPILVNQLLNVTPSATIHIPSLIYHGQQIGDFDIDFSWYATYKVYVDVILNAFLIIGYLYWLFISFGSHLRGHFIDYEPNNPDSNARLFRG